MKSLVDIVPESTHKLKVGSADIGINQIRIDSREVSEGDCFVALPGTVADGHAFIDQAIENGARAIVCEHLPENTAEDICYLVVEDATRVLAQMAGNYYQHPSRELILIGVTGTNGKTTTVTLIYQMIEELGYKCGMISTIENKIHEDIETASHTTPNVLKINELLRKMVDKGCTYAAMEVSSHAIDQKRVEGLAFDVAVFTNLSHDHLDYHGDFKNYIYTKKKFFDNLNSRAFALVNRDDKNGKVMVQNSLAIIKTYAIQRMADFKARVLDNSLEGLHLQINGKEVYSRLVGKFNAYNILAAYGVSQVLGQEDIETLKVLSMLSSAAGRFQFVRVVGTQKTGIVDYAHTPDALAHVIQTILDIKPSTVRLISVVGAGGDRDRTKRPLMASIAARLSDQVLLTSDNPRTEDPDGILEEMMQGVPQDCINKVIVLADRKQAIKTAVSLAREGDIVLVAGKGHENYQEINKVKHPFDDRKILKHVC